MKRFLLLLFLLTFLFTSDIYSQGPPSTSGTIYFQYDTSGNQKSRAWCLNCANKSSTTKEKDSILAEIIDEPLGEMKSNIVAYPNPVKDYLHLEWIENPTQQPSSLFLFSIDSKLIYQRRIKEKRGNAEISLENYPSGVYILLVEYTNGKKESFTIIKI